MNSSVKLKNKGLAQNKKSRKSLLKVMFEHKFLFLFVLAQFFVGLEYSGVIMIPFFKNWGGLNQFQIQILQSWFMLWIFILEIPTGLIGDKIGVKFSTLFGFALKALGIFVYVTIPNFYVFLLAEFIFAIGAAFVSGSQEAWIYELAKEHDVVDYYTDMQMLLKNSFLVGLVFTSLTASFVAQYLDLRFMFGTELINLLIALLFFAFIPKPQKDVQVELAPDYISMTKESIKVIKNNRLLIEDIVFLTVLTSLGYFVIWLYQTMMLDIGLAIKDFGIYRLIVLFSQITVGYILARILKNKRTTRKLDVFLAFLMGTSYIVAGILQNLTGLIVYLLIAGGLGLQIRTVYSKQLNEHIPSDKRATVLSLISMIRKIVLVVLNPIVGALVDYKGINLLGRDFSGLYLSFLMLGFAGIVIAIYRFFRQD